jgi:hypothetical protein
MPKGKGELHSRMEGWLDGKAISAGQYTPQPLGTGDDDALSGFLPRMEGLIAYSRERAEKLRPHVAALKTGRTCRRLSG